MKSLTLLVFIVFLSFSLYAQEESPVEEKDTKESEKVEEVKKSDDQSAEEKSEDDSVKEDDEAATETKSFTLDADDAVVETIVVSEEEPEVEVSEASETTTYHYNSNQSNDEIQTLGGNGKNSHHGGFGAVTFKASEFNNKDIIMVGLRGGWIINRAMAIGFEGYGIIPTAEYENIDPSSPLTSRAVGGYGGMFIEPIVLSNKVVHVTFPVAIGGGWLGYIVDWEENNDYYSNDLIDDDVFWYVEPGASLELNVARNFRIDLGASYRFTKDLDLINTSSSAFDAWNYFLTLKFGSF